MSKAITSPMMILKITSSVDYNYWLKRLCTQHDESIIHILDKSSRLLSQRIRLYYKTLGTGLINNVSSLPDLMYIRF